MEAGDQGRRRTAEGEPAAAAEAGEKCPRCGSRDTKFCYYNNYNMSQPRHFCKSCRRYWTLGGSLRNVPVGGSSRKRLRPSPASTAPAIRIGSPLPGLSPLADLVAASNSLPPLGRGAGAVLRLDDPLLPCRGGFGLGLGLGLGRGSGAVGEEMGFGLASSLLWPPTPSSLLDDANETWRLGNGGEGDCSFATTGSAGTGWTDLAISGPTDGGGAPPAREVR